MSGKHFVEITKDLRLQ